MNTARIHRAARRTSSARRIARRAAAAAAVLVTAGACNAVQHAPAFAHVGGAPLGSDSASYIVRIRRDAWGVPHVRGRRDADAAFGLAYAHAEDDFATIQEALLATRGRVGELTGRFGAAQDYAWHLLGVRTDVEARYARDLAPATRALVEAYAAGLNDYAARYPREVRVRGLFPVTGRDVVTGFALTSPFFFGLDRVLGALHDGTPLPRDAEPAADTTGGALPRGENEEPPERGSNAFAVAPARAPDRATRLLLNSHQPWTGPVAWYEAHVTSDEGLDMAGALFPGAPLPLTGHNGALGWANTINRPDLVDVYRLERDASGRRYRYDGQWLPLEERRVWLRVRVGPFVIPLPQTVRRSVHGPVIINRTGAYAVRYAGMGEIRQVEQYYRLARARTLTEWRAVMSLQAIPATNFVYADSAGHIGLFYNARFPRRAPGYDYRGVLPGDTSAVVWTTYVPFDSVPQLVDPSTGFVVNANNTPFLATAPGGNLDPAAFPMALGIETDISNRILRATRRLASHRMIDSAALWAVKMDAGFEPDAPQGRFLARLTALSISPADSALASAQRLLAGWDRHLDGVGPADALAALVLRPVNRALYLRRAAPDPRATLAEAAAFLMTHHRRLDPPLGDLLRLQRGTVDIPLAGGPDALRAIGWEPDARGRLVADFGDAYMMLVTWDSTGHVHAGSVHQFGAATSRPASAHFADQAPLFARGALRPAWFTEADVAAHTRCAYAPGAERDACHVGGHDRGVRAERRSTP